MHVNEVLLVGRLAATPQVRRLPSGDQLVSWRLIVDRNERSAVRRMVDTLDCSAVTAAVRKAAARWAPGDLVEVEGALRRRFWRAGTGLASRCEVAATRVRRIARAN
jgi:single-strand DNA-binding protein